MENLTNKKEEATKVENRGQKTKERSGTIISLNFKDETETFNKLEEFLERCNDKEFGKRIIPLNIIVYAINLLKDSDISEIQSMALTSKDRFMKLLSDAKKTNTITNDDEFYELAMKTIKSKLPTKSLQ